MDTELDPTKGPPSDEEAALLRTVAGQFSRPLRVLLLRAARRLEADYLSGGRPINRDAIARRDQEIDQLHQTVRRLRAQLQAAAVR